MLSLAALAATTSLFASFPSVEYRLPWHYKGERLYYRSCGAADACWVAEVRETKTKQVKARLRCDSTKMFYSVGNTLKELPFSESCDTANTDEKFKIIPKLLQKILQRT